MKKFSNKYAVYSMQFPFRALNYILFTAYCLLTIAYSFSQTEYEPPKLTCVRNIGAPSPGTELNWTLPSTPNPCFTGYEIYATTGNINGTYSLVATVVNPLQTSLQINPPTIILSDGTDPAVSFFYMINRGSCNNPTPPANITSDTLANRTRQPFVPFINATVIDNKITVNWQPAPSVEVVGYQIYSSLDGFTNPMDTINGRLNTQFIDSINNPNATAVEYSIRAFEVCEVGLGTSSIFVNETHKTIFLRNTTPDKCTQTINISWSSYKAGSARVLGYTIETNTQDAGFIQAGTTDSSGASFLLQNIPFRKHFCFRVKAILPNNVSAYSNEICYDSLNVIQKPMNDYIRNISVENGNIIIEYKKDTAAAPAKTVLPQRSNDGIVFTPIINTPTEPDINTYLFTESGLPVGNQTYTYKINLLDSCNSTHSSDTATTLRLAIKVKNNNKATILWNGFEIDNITFDNFRLEKIVAGDTIFIGNFNRNETTFSETALFDYSLDSLGEVCYRVTALFENNNDVTPRETLESHSNIVCVQPEPKAFVPQAFVPTGHNNTFKPFLLYAKSDNYDFKIYDRWYRLVYSTNDINASWNGTFKDAPALLDAYIYIVKFRGKDDKDYTQTGTVMLLK